MTNKVWVTQERFGFNYTDAERFGEIDFVTSRDYTLPMNAPGNLTIRTALASASKKFDPDTDSILISGSPVIAGVLIGKIIAEHDPRTLRIVKWDNRDNEYNIMNVEL